jgi:hypothetical protein
LVKTGGASFPQRRLYLLPEPQGQVAFRGVSLDFSQNELGGAGAAGAGLQNELMPDSRKRCESCFSARAIKASILAGPTSGVGLGWVLVGEWFLDGAAFLQLAEFGEGTAEDEMGLRAGAVYGFLLLFGAFFHETVGGAHNFVGERLFDSAVGSEFGREGGEDVGLFLFFSVTDEIVSDEQALTP